VAGLPGPERELDRVMRHRHRAGGVAALVLLVVSDRRDRDEHVQRRDGERVRGLVGRQRGERLAVDELGADQTLWPPQERIP